MTSERITQLRALLARAIDGHAASCTAISDQIWDRPELGFDEHFAASLQADTLRAAGFAVTSGLAGIPTAFAAEAGQDGPVIAILGEFDALAGMSQKPGVDRADALAPGQPGHGCGHNLLGAGGMLAAMAVADVLAQDGLPGRIRYYGCPAEEGGAGKTFMVRDGVFDDVDIALTWHPATHTSVSVGVGLAMIQAVFDFTGRSSHAAMSPDKGRSALDAVELMNVGVNYLREHVSPEARIHYAYRDAGGSAPNVVQAKACVAYMIREPRVSEAMAIHDRIRDIASGAALMTGTQVTSRVESGMSSVTLNTTLGQLLHRNLTAIGPVPFDADDEQTARRFFHANQEQGPAAGVGHNLSEGDALDGRIAPFDGTAVRQFGSTDVGDVSAVVPTAQFWGTTCARDTAFHSWQMVAQGQLPAAHKGMIHAAGGLAGAAIEALLDPGIIAAAKAEFRDRRAGPYLCPIPDESQPPVNRSE